MVVAGGGEEGTTFRCEAAEVKVGVCRLGIPDCSARTLSGGLFGYVHPNYCQPWSPDLHS